MYHEFQPSDVKNSACRFYKKVFLKGIMSDDLLSDEKPKHPGFHHTHKNRIQSSDCHFP